MEEIVTIISFFVSIIALTASILTSITLRQTGKILKDIEKELHQYENKNL